MINLIVTVAAMTLAYRAMRRADRRVNWLLIGMTGLATALLVLLVASLIIVARPGLWRT